MAQLARIWKQHRVLFMLVLVSLAFLVKVASVIHVSGRRPDRPDVWENNVFHSVRVYLEHGLTSNAGLPVYPMVHETPIERLRETLVYTHFFPGDSYVLYGLAKIFGSGESLFHYGRFLPVFLSLLAVLLVSRVLARDYLSGWRSGEVWAVGILLFSPCLYIWSTSLTGIGYAHALILVGWWLGFEGSLWLKQGSNAPRSVLLYGGAFVLGLGTIYLLLHAVFVVCIAPLVGALMQPRLEVKNLKYGLGLAFVTGLGIVAGYLLHFWQIAAYLDSWALAWDDQIGTFLARGEDRRGTTRLVAVGRYSDHVRAFFRLNALHMFFSGLFLAWLIRSSKELRARSALAMTLATIGAYTWPLLMLHSAEVHWFAVPHIFLIVYLVWAALGLRVARERISS